MNKQIHSPAVFAAVLGAVLLVGAYLLPWDKVNWGKVEMLPGSAITVTGQARSQQRSQIARFTAGVTAVNDNKDTAVKEVNEKVTEIIKAIKDFGIDEVDIKTRNISVNQMEEPVTFDGRRKVQPGQWRVTNSIEIKLKDVDKASDLADLLTQSGATNVHGPSFSLDDTQEFETALLEDAVDAAREKAERIAKASGRKLGKVLNVNEGMGGANDIRPFAVEKADMGGGAPIEPGSSTLTKTVTVTFELK